MLEALLNNYRNECLIDLFKQQCTGLVKHMELSCIVLEGISLSLACARASVEWKRRQTKIVEVKFSKIIAGWGATVSSAPQTWDVRPP